jgi:hypothetical protein
MRAAAGDPRGGRQTDGLMHSRRLCTDKDIPALWEAKLFSERQDANNNYFIRR